MLNVLAFILLIGPLIFFHELGHLIAAKLVDVKCTRFSIGFGPPLARFRAGETEYCIAPIPLGGYVAMLGHGPQEDVPASEMDRALSSKPLWARYFVLFAGPAANLLLPIVVYFFYSVITASQVTPPVVGTVVPDSAAEQAGLQQGDRIVAIDDRDVRSFREMQRRVADAPGEELKIQIERDGKRIDRAITPSKVLVTDFTGRSHPIGRMGILANSYVPQIGILDPESPAYVAGLRTGDVITLINGEPVRTIEELQQMLEVTSNTRVALTYLRPQQVRGELASYLWYESHHASFLAQKASQGDETGGTGLYPAQTFIRAVDRGSPADLAGLSPGDRVLEVDGKRVLQWTTVLEALTRSGKEPLEFLVQSPGSEQPRTVTVELTERTWKDIYKQEHTRMWFGAEPYAKSRSPELEPVRGRFTYSLAQAFRLTADDYSQLWSVLVRLTTTFEGADPSSVIGLYHVAGIAYDQGPGRFLQMLALISINLGIVNLLPIPILDGGHILFFTIEGIRRRPLGQRAREIASAIGLVLILLLLLIATRNDIMRFWMTDDDAEPPAPPVEPKTLESESPGEAQSQP